ncbi:hypothetical protein GCM10028773_25060 [Spirosoma koreense]
MLHSDMDTFFVSVERLENEALIGKPVITGGTPYLSVFAARQFGVYGSFSVLEFQFTV